jgi:hypothetical protein
MVTDLLLVGDDEGVLLQHGALRAFYTSENFFRSQMGWRTIGTEIAVGHRLPCRMVARLFYLSWSSM